MYNKKFNRLSAVEVVELNSIVNRSSKKDLKNLINRLSHDEIKTMFLGFVKSRAPSCGCNTDALSTETTHMRLLNFKQQCVECNDPFLCELKNGKHLHSLPWNNVSFTQNYLLEQILMLKTPNVKHVNVNNEQGLLV